MEILAENKKAFFDYEIIEKYEGGLVLLGHEVKSIKNKRINLSGSYVIVKKNGVYLLNSDIPPYQPTNIPFDYNPKRTRKILLHKKELESLLLKTQQKGLTFIPLKVYNKNGLIKLEFALAKGKRLFDKREKIKKREFERKIKRVFKNN